MSYLALYRKWRPEDFDLVKGQDAVVRTLRNQIIYDRIGHAYLFCGTRGTGKTSIAKIFAKAVNCENPRDGNPCGVCASCRAIADQASMDIIEIDAASHNGVDDVRLIREQVQYMPASGRYKIYIIDEVHMLSHPAFNALLKTLEEPPSYVIFILATTEKHKVPVTILSRCQQYDFRRISVTTITDHLSDLMARENIEIEPKALEFIARMADGSMRDSLSLLDQCIALYPNQLLSYDKVVDVLGATDISVFGSLLKCVSSKDIPGVLDIIDRIILEGRELLRFLNDFLWYLRNLLLLKDSDASNSESRTEVAMNMSTENIERMRAEASLITTGELLRMIKALSELAYDLRYATQKRVIAEVGFIKLCRPDTEASSDALLARIERLEEDLAQKTAFGLLSSGGSERTAAGTAGQGIPAGPGAVPAPGSSPGPAAGEGNNAVSAGDGNSGSGYSSSQDPELLLKERFTPAEAEDLKKIAGSWNQIVGSTDNPMRRHLRQAKISVAEDSDVLILVFDESNFLSDNAMSYFDKNNHENLELLSEIVAKRTGKQVSFRCIMKQAKQIPKDTVIDLTKIKFDGIEYED